MVKCAKYVYIYLQKDIYVIFEHFLFLAIVFAKTAKNLFLFSKMHPVFVENVYKFNAFFIKFFVIGWCGCIFASD